MKTSIKLSRMGGDPQTWMSCPIGVLMQWLEASSELYQEEHPDKEEN